jgi:hypothetical protein
VIIIMVDEGDIHPAEFVTVKVYVPADRLDILVLIPEPAVVTSPGERISVQIPVAGKPFKTTSPDGTAQVGCVIVPTIGATGLGFTIRE